MGSPKAASPSPSCWPSARAGPPIANAVPVRPLCQTAGRIRWHVAGVPGLFLADYASVKAMVQFRRAGVGARNPDTCLGRGLGRQPPRAARDVQAAVGLGLIGPDLASWGDCVSAHIQPGDRDAA